MDLDRDQPAAAPQEPDVPGDLVIPYPVPPGLLAQFIEALDGGDEGPEANRRTVVFVSGVGLAPDVLVGWQVGVLVRLLPHRPAAVRGVEPEVLRRATEVLHRIEEAR